MPGPAGAPRPPAAVSFDDAFDASYRLSPIGKATAEQLRLALLTADEVRDRSPVGRDHRCFGNRYWSPEMSALAGQKVTVRFDPDDLTLPVHVYDTQRPLHGDRPDPRADRLPRRRRRPGAGRARSASCARPSGASRSSRT
jgi:hypothetical protein